MKKKTVLCICLCLIAVGAWAQTIYKGTGADDVANTLIGYFASSSTGEGLLLATAPSVFDGTTWDRMAGNSVGLFVQGTAAHDAANTGNPAKIGAVAVADSAAPGVVSTAADITNLKATMEGRLLVDSTHPNRITCVQTISTATSLTAMPTCTAPGSGKSIYVTDISFATNAGAIAADSFNTLKYGTGGTCGSGTTVFWGAMSTAATQTTTFQAFITPIKIPANNEICWINSTAGSKFIVINGFIAP